MKSPEGHVMVSARENLFLPVSVCKREMTRSQCKVRDELHRRISHPRASYPLQGLAAITSLTAPALKVRSIGDDAPELPIGCVAAVFAGRDGSRCGLLYLSNVMARKMIDHSLHRTASSATFDSLTSFDIGILLQILDSGMADWRCNGYPNMELRGILDSAAQVRLFLSSSSQQQWHVRAALESAEVSGDVVIVGCRLPLEALNNKVSVDMSVFGPLPVVLRMVVGHSAIRRDERIHLAVGDFIVLDDLGYPASIVENRGFQLQSGYYAITAEWKDERSFWIREGKSMQNGEQTQQLSMQMPHEAAAGLEVPLRVEVAQLSTTVEMVSKLVAGQVIQLNQPVSDEVVVRAGEKLICKGRLVQVEGDLAVEVIELL